MVLKLQLLASFRHALILPFFLSRRVESLDEDNSGEEMSDDSDDESEDEEEIQTSKRRRHK